MCILGVEMKICKWVLINFVYRCFSKITLKYIIEIKIKVLDISKVYT